MSKTVCTVEGCRSPASTKNRCPMHYERFKRNGHDGLEGRKTLACTAEGCDRSSGRSPLCRMHRQRVAKSGTLETTNESPGTSLEWLTRQVESRDRSKCWEWPFKTGLKGGYGMIGRKVATHVALELDNRTRPEKPDNNALHSCDNPPCTNPDHLRWGSHAANVRDREERTVYSVKRGRPFGHEGLSGASNGNAKLSDADVADIRKRYVKGSPRYPGNGQALADEYGVSRKTIGMIVRMEYRT